MFTITKSQLKIFSAVCSNFVVVWLAAIVGSNDPFILTFDIISAIVSWKLAVKTEEILEENYD